jgi:hypothetical protein
MTPTALDEIDYLEESGPGIPELPEGPAADQVPAGAIAEIPPSYPGWEPETVEQFLKGTGYGIHMLIGQAENDWKMTETDLERIVPPLTRICNRWEPALRLSPIADPLLVAHGFALYGWRSALERQRALKDKQAGQRPATGERYERAGGDVDEDQAEDLDLGELAHEPYFPDNGTGGAHE